MLEPATAADLDAINRLSAQVIKLHASWRPDVFQKSDESYTTEILDELIREKSVYVAKKDGIVIGYTAFWIWEPSGPCFVNRKVMSINDFCVDDACRGIGIGTQMMHEISEIATLRSCTDMELSVYPQNCAALSFYRKCGFDIKSCDMHRKV